MDHSEHSFQPSQSLHISFCKTDFQNSLPIHLVKCFLSGTVYIQDVAENSLRKSGNAWILPEAFKTGLLMLGGPMKTSPFLGEEKHLLVIFSPYECLLDLSNKYPGIFYCTLYMHIFTI